MKYEVGEKVVLRDDLDKIHFANMKDMEGKEVRINHVDHLNENYCFGSYLFTDDMIDHEKTAELNKETISGQPNEKLAELVGDAINQPAHYNQGEYEAIDVIKDITRDYSGYEGYLVGNIIKYLYRSNYKANKVEDLKKVQWHVDELVHEVDQ